MNDEVFNLELRRFLKRFGITAQREIERAVAGALERSALSGDEVLPVRATLEPHGLRQICHDFSSLHGRRSISPHPLSLRRRTAPDAPIGRG